jgi:hypothetical protein
MCKMKRSLRDLSFLDLGSVVADAKIGSRCASDLGVSSGLSNLTLKVPSPGHGPPDSGDRTAGRLESLFDCVDNFV